ncbi:MAG TPA: Flp family type IVb pilin [Stellaceae bacterium]|nr:Flp family type IVb pilin [Stellaceae bacterium]
MHSLWQTWRRSSRGAVQVEYGLLVALIALALIGYLVTFGNTLAAKYAVLAQTLQ